MNSNLLLPKNILFPIAFFGLVFTLFSVSFDFTRFGIPQETGKVIPILALICNFVTVVFLIIDVFKNNLSTKYLWTLGFLLVILRDRDKFLKSI